MEEEKGGCGGDVEGGAGVGGGGCGEGWDGGDVEGGVCGHGFFVQLFHMLGWNSKHS